MFACISWIVFCLNLQVKTFEFFSSLLMSRSSWQRKYSSAFDHFDGHLQGLC